MKGFNALQEKMLGDKNVAIGQVSYALACADRHTGPSTTSISLAWFPLRGSLINDHGQPTALTTPCTLASVGYLELRLDSGGDWVCNDEIGRFWRSMLQRLPNLVYASLSLSTLSKAPMVPLLQLKHLELSLQTLDGLACMPFGACLPSLETASIKASFQPWPDRIGFISELNVLGCTHLRQLVVSEVLVCSVLKPAQCRLRLDWLKLRLCCASLDKSQLLPALTEAHEVLLAAEELYLLDGLVSLSCLPALEVIRCDWDDWDVDDEQDRSLRWLANTLVHCMRHSRNLPALRSIICSDHDREGRFPMKIRIPANLASVKELVIATDRPLHLLFESASGAGKTLDGFCVVGSEVRMDYPAPFLNALFERRLAVGIAEAGQAHMDAPSQCVYMRKIISDPEFSYDDAIRAVNARVHQWGEHDLCCGQCGVCFKCLESEGVLDGRWCQAYA